jgi:Spy/CpxP family protein refolding chaperone
VSIYRFLAAASLPLVFALPVAAQAQQRSIMVAQATAPTSSDMKAAVKKALQSVNLTHEQKRQIAPMIKNYESQTANADPATTEAAKKSLMKNIYGVLTPSQQTQFKASMKQSLGSM